MEANMSLDEVKMGIQRLTALEENLSKKKVKLLHPQLMRNALHYFPNWESAIKQSIS
ncbi:hypothetical protein JOC85_003850 [Bacillus mesophilus]|uniref:hypothetical protein n=1 Tax=Bacillus mesophilus TaxID=1808955 RepID=UPI0013D6556C|nr:hypothetical protein [Bacillus mesophilus]MBM7663024.1 hypothetical protein [Bacillus mesophilus]